MNQPVVAIKYKQTGDMAVINLSDLDAAQHEPVVPDVTGATRTAAHTKQDTDRAIAKEIHGRQRI